MVELNARLEKRYKYFIKKAPLSIKNASHDRILPGFVLYVVFITRLVESVIIIDKFVHFVI